MDLHILLLETLLWFVVLILWAPRFLKTLRQFQISSGLAKSFYFQCTILVGLVCEAIKLLNAVWLIFIK